MTMSGWAPPGMGPTGSGGFSGCRSFLGVLLGSWSLGATVAVGSLGEKPLALLGPPKLEMARQQVGGRWTPAHAGASKTPTGHRRPQPVGLGLVSAPISSRGEGACLYFPSLTLAGGSGKQGLNGDEPPPAPGLLPALHPLATVTLPGAAFPTPTGGCWPTPDRVGAFSGCIRGDRCRQGRWHGDSSY